MQRALAGRESEIVALVEATYRWHAAGESVNPPSYFLRFPDRPTARIIALPASLGGEVQVDGLKWVSSFPGNVAAGIPRASAVLILNDRDDRLPARRAGKLDHQRHPHRRLRGAGRRRAHPHPGRPARVGFVGAGLIARYVHTFLAGTGWSFDEIGVHDVSPDSAAGFRGYLERTGRPGRIMVHATAEELIRSSDLVVFATVAASPTSTRCRGSPTTRWCCTCRCATSRRRSCSASTNIVDDVEHCLKADTSPHLTEQLTGNRDFLTGTLAEVIDGRVDVPADRLVVFSPFGLGVLDLAVGKHVYDRVPRRRTARHRRLLPRPASARLSWIPRRPWQTASLCCWRR